MAYEKIIWDVIGHTTNRYIFNGVESTLENTPDKVTQEGDVLNAEQMNDMNDRIYNAFKEVDDANTPVINTGSSSIQLKKLGIIKYDLEGNETREVWNLPSGGEPKPKPVPASYVYYSGNLYKEPYYATLFILTWRDYGTISDFAQWLDSNGYTRSTRGFTIDGIFYNGNNETAHYITSVYTGVYRDGTRDITVRADNGTWYTVVAAGLSPVPMTKIRWT